jgi:hypothetical protein
VNEGCAESPTEGLIPVRVCVDTPADVSASGSETLAQPIPLPSLFLMSIVLHAFSSIMLMLVWLN